MVTVIKRKRAGEIVGEKDRAWQRKRERKRERERERDYVCSDSS